METPHERIARILETAEIIFDGALDEGSDLGFSEAQGDEPSPSVSPAPFGDEPDRGCEPASSFWARVRACAQLLPNDTDNGHRLRIWHGDVVLHVKAVGWYFWTGRVWDGERGEYALQRIAQVTAKLIAHEAEVIEMTAAQQAAVAEMRRAKLVPPDQRSAEQAAAIEDGSRALAAWGTRTAKRTAFSVTSGNSARLANMIAEALPHKVVAIDAMDGDVNAFNVENGTLRFSRVPDLECLDPEVTRYVPLVELTEHRRLDYMTKMAPVAYDPAARCPRWHAFLERFQPKPRIRRFLQIFHGYAMLGSMGAQQLVFSHGEGANGKSTFIEAICRVMGAYAGVLNPESISGTGTRQGAQASPDLATLPGKRLVRISELPRGEPLKEALVKHLTGGEPMLVRQNYGDFYPFKPCFKASMSGNDKPTIGGVDYGIWRRLRLVPWEVTIDDAERRDLEDVLAEFWQERAGILNWMVEGALIYLAEGLVAPPEVVDATAAYRSEMDHVQGFVDGCVLRTGDENDCVQALPLYQAYEAYCLSNAIKPFSNKAFSQIFQKKGFRKSDPKSRIRFFYGLKLHDVPERPRNPDEREGWHAVPDP
jgi:putative DNA primase/helicase